MAALRTVLFAPPSVSVLGLIHPSEINDQPYILGTRTESTNTMVPFGLPTVNIHVEVIVIDSSNCKSY